MKKLVLFLSLFAIIVHAESSLYLDAGGKGIGIGEKLKYKIVNVHFGAHVLPNYQFIKPTDSTYQHWLGTDLYPYLGIGKDFKLNENYSISSYFDFIYGLSFGYEKTNRSQDLFSSDPMQFLLRTGFGIIVNRWKVPIEFSTDFYYLHKYSNLRYQILPRITIYLK
jgi:hypothetical protein